MSFLFDRKFCLKREQIFSEHYFILPEAINVVYGLVWDAKSNILGASTKEELDQIEIQFDFARRFYAGIGS